MIFHLSKSINLKELSPKIPDKLLVRKNAFEDITIKRISFSDSIYGCILGLQMSERDFGNSKTMSLYAYSPATKLDSKYTVSNEEIINRKLVFDAHITNEFWYLKSIPVNRVGKVIIKKNFDDYIEFTPLRIGDPKYLNKDGKIRTYIPKYIYIQEFSN